MQIFFIILTSPVNIDSSILSSCYSYNILLMLVNYFVPLGILAGTYTRVGCELWGSQFIGEYNVQQAESVRSKRRVGLESIFHWHKIFI